MKGMMDMLNNYLKRLCFLLFPYYVLGCLYIRNELRIQMQSTYDFYNGAFFAVLLCIGIGLFMFFWTCVRLDKKSRRIIELINVTAFILIYLNFRFEIFINYITLNTFFIAMPVAVIYIGFTITDFTISIVDDYRIKRMK